MLGSIRGKVLGFEVLTALIETRDGLGYEVEVPASYLSELKVDQECFLYLHHIVREDAQLLFGFHTKEERLLFRELIKLNGIGPRIAMAILSVFTLNDFVAAIKEERLNAIVAVPGVGKKTAERIVVEMRDRIDKLRINNAPIPAGSQGALDIQENSAQEEERSSAFNCEDAIGALVSLGFKENQAMTTVRAVYQPGMSAEEIIVAALQQLNKH